MKRRITSVAMTAMLGLTTAVAQNGQFDPYFTTLPVETGQGVVTTLNYYNGGDNWTGFLGIPGIGTTMGKTTWGRFNNPWGGNGRVWLECVDGEKGLYVLAAQGHYVTGFTDNGNGKAVSITGDVGDKESALRFTVRLKSEEEGVVAANDYPEYEFKTEDGKWIIQGINNRVNNLIAISATTIDAETSEEVPTVETGSWQIGTWQGVGFARLDVKTWDGPSGGGGTLCADGFYYATLCLPYEVQVPQGNLFPDSTAIPSIQYGDQLVQAWSIFDSEENGANEFDLVELKPGDVVPAGSLLLVKAKYGNVDFLINPGTGYVDSPDEESLAVGYYAVPTTEEVFHLHVADGYPKFMKGKMTVNEEYSTPVQFTIADDNAVTAIADVIGGKEGGHSQPNVNIGFIDITRDNRQFVEYRLETDKNKLVGYENPDYAKVAKNTLPAWITADKVDAPFFNASADTAALAQKIREFVGDKSLEEYDALKAEFSSTVIMPEKAYIQLKINGEDGKSMMVGNAGLVANCDWPWERTGSRVFFEKVGENQYKLGLNGKWIQDPANLSEDGFVTAGAEAHVFTVNVIEPGKITITSGDLALIGDGNVLAGDLMVENEDGEMEINNNAIWHVDNSRPWMQFSATIVIDGRYYTSVCVPYRLGPNPVTVESEGVTESEGLDTELYEVKWNDNDEIELIRVNELPAGMPGIISGSTDFIKVGIVGTDYATAPIAPTGDYALNGCFDLVPEEGAVTNMKILGTMVIPGDIIGEGDDVTYGPDVTKLALVDGSLDGTDLRQINKAYFESPSPNDVALILPDKNWAREAEKILGAYTTEANTNGAFQLTSAQAADFKLKIAQVIDEAGYNALAAEMTAAVTLPESFYGALKDNGGQYMGDRNQADRSGLYSDFGTPNGANGRVVMKMVEGGYTVAFNGAYIQAPVDGANAVLGTEPIVFDVTVVAPGTIKISKDGVYLVDGGNLKGGADGETALYTVDNAYTNILRQSTTVASGDMRFGAITAPFDVVVDRALDAAAVLYTVSYDEAKDSLVLTAVDKLTAGTPGIVAGTSNPVVLNIEGGWAVNQAFDPAVAGIKGILNIKPIEGTEAVNAYVLGTDAAGKLAMVKSATYDINQIFFEAPASADADGDTYISFTSTPTKAEGIKNVIVINSNLLNNNFIYNLQGQRVTENYKGIVIKNGQKFIQK